MNKKKIKEQFLEELEPEKYYRMKIQEFKEKHKKRLKLLMKIFHVIFREHRWYVAYSPKDDIGDVWKCALCGKLKIAYEEPRDIFRYFMIYLAVGTAFIIAPHLLTFFPVSLVVLVICSFIIVLGLLSLKYDEEINDMVWEELRER